MIIWSDIYIFCSKQGKRGNVNSFPLIGSK